LDDVPGLGSAEKDALLQDAVLPALESLREEAANSFSSELRRLVDEGRVVLRSNDG
jgi:hypothetical protein